MKNEKQKQLLNDALAMTRRSVCLQDEAFLYQLYASSRRDEIAAWGWDEMQQQAFLRMQFRAQQQSYGRQYARADHQIILLDDRPIGRIMIDRTEEEIRLVDIALLPEHRGAGIGTSLIQNLLAEAAETGKPVRLQVLRTNRAARLYQRLGFVTTGDSDIYLRMEWRPGG